MEEFFFEGITLHNGSNSKIKVIFDENLDGIFFKKGKSKYKLDLKNVKNTNHATTLDFNDFQVSTVEHLLSSLNGLDLFNVIIEIIEGNEIPILDGSSKEFVDKFINLKFNSKKSCLKIIEKFSYKNKNCKIDFEPYEGFFIDYSIFFDDNLIKNQTYSITINPNNYIDEISKARTFGFVKDFEFLKSMNLIKGGSLENAIVIDGNKILNPPLRFENEFVRHKILDLIGDFTILNKKIYGKLIIKNGGHFHHISALKELLKFEKFYQLF